MKTTKTVFKKTQTFRRILASFLLMVVFASLLPTTALAASTSYQYKVVAVKKLDDKVLCSTPFATVTGDPNVTISITRTQSVSRTYSCKVNVTIKEINAALGWSKSETDEVSVSNGGSWKVPSKENGKKVAKGTLQGYVYMDRYEYKIMRRTVTIGHGGRGGMSVRYGKWEDWKTGCIACKARPNDIYYKKTVTYK